MPRKPRLHIPGGVYHVMLRGKEDEHLFYAKSDYLYFYDLLAEGTERFGYRVHGACLLPDEVSLVLEVGDISISRLMQNLTFRYTRHVNERRDRTGPLFQGRFKAVIIDAKNYLQDLVAYVHQFPVMEKKAKRADAYAWSGHRCYLGKEDLPWMTCDRVLGSFAKSVPAARKRYLALVKKAQAEGYRPEFHWGGADPRVLAEGRVLKKALTPVKKPGKAPSLSAVVRSVCSTYGVKASELTTPSRVRLLAEVRGIIGWLARETEAAALTEVAERFNRDLSSLSRSVTRVENLEASDPSFAKELRALQKSLRRA